MAPKAPAKPKARDGQPTPARRSGGGSKRVGGASKSASTKASTARGGKAAGKATRRSKRAKQGAKAKAADRAAAKAKDAGAQGGQQLTVVQRELRDSAIVARTAAGWTAAMAADEFGVTQRTIERVLAKHREMPSPLKARPMDVVEEFARGIAASVGDFQAMAWAQGEKNPHVALGALKAANDARRELRELLAAVGVWPDDLSALLAENELRSIAHEMTSGLRQLVAGETTPEALLARFEEWTAEGAP